MSMFDLETKLIHTSQCIDALILLTQRRETHGLDNGLLEQEIEELIRARYDHIREFEDECVKRGEFRATQYKDGVCKDCGGGINSHKYPCSAT